jgi:hypothetical protein
MKQHRITEEDGMKRKQRSQERVVDSGHLYTYAEKTMKHSLIALVCLASLVSDALCESPDVLTIPCDLTVPKVTTGEPAPGKRVLQAMPHYEDSAIRHALYLPTDWEKGKTYPVLVEYTGNHGTVAGAKLAKATGSAAGKGSCGSVCLT